LVLVGQYISILLVQPLWAMF